MRIVFKYTIFTILAALFLMPAFVSAQTDPGSAKGRNTEQTTRKPDEKSAESGKSNKTAAEQVEFVFPDIEDWQRGEVRTYPNEALGFSVPYMSEEGGMVTIYVYNAGLSSIPTDLNDKIVKNEIERAKNDIIQIGKSGIYEGVREIKSDTVTLGGATGKVRALRALYYFKIKGEEVDSEIYLFSYKNNFIKIRATRPKAKNGAENKALASFLAEIDKMFAS